MEKIKCEFYQSENAGPYGFCKHLIFDEEAASNRKPYKERIYANRYCKIKHYVIKDRSYMLKKCFKNLENKKEIEKISQMRLKAKRSQSPCRSEILTNEEREVAGLYSSLHEFSKKGKFKFFLRGRKSTSESRSKSKKLKDAFSKKETILINIEEVEAVESLINCNTLIETKNLTYEIWEIETKNKLIPINKVNLSKTYLSRCWDGIYQDYGQYFNHVWKRYEGNDFPVSPTDGSMLHYIENNNYILKRRVFTEKLKKEILHFRKLEGYEKEGKTWNPFYGFINEDKFYGESYC
jgi:hypothetical protein